MTIPQIWEIIGYLGSLLVLISMFMTSIVKLRLVNTIGSFIFCVYAIAIGSYPTAFLNGALVLVNIYNLIRLTRIEKEFSLIEVNADDITLLHFLKHQLSDILKFFPDFEISPDYNKAYLVYQGTTIVCVCLGRLKGETSIELSLDYAIPSYRDFAVGSYIYDRLSAFGYQSVSFTNPSTQHIPYLIKMGYEAKGNNLYVKKLEQWCSNFIYLSKIFRPSTYFSTITASKSL